PPRVRGRDRHEVPGRLRIPSAREPGAAPHLQPHSHLRQVDHALPTVEPHELIPVGISRAGEREQRRQDRPRAVAVVHGVMGLGDRLRGLIRHAGTLSGDVAVSRPPSLPARPEVTLPLESVSDNAVLSDIARVGSWGFADSGLTPFVRLIWQPGSGSRVSTVRHLRPVEPDAPAAVPTADAIAAYLQWFSAKRGRSGRITSPQTLRAYTTALPTAFAGYATLADLANDGGRRLRANIRDAWGDKAPATLNARRAAVASALRFFRHQGWIPSDLDALDGLAR